MARSLRTLALILATHRALARLGARRTVFDGVRARRGPSTSKVVDVYAVGDVCTRYQFTHVAGTMAGMVVNNALFGGKHAFSRLVVPGAERLTARSCGLLRQGT